MDLILRLRPLRTGFLEEFLVGAATTLLSHIHIGLVQVAEQAPHLLTDGESTFTMVYIYIL